MKGNYGVVLHPENGKPGTVLAPRRFADRASAERFAVWLAAYNGKDAILLDGYHELPAAGRAALRSVARVERDGRWRGWAIPPLFSAEAD
jgi:hypothetical protein